MILVVMCITTSPNLTQAQKAQAEQFRWRFLGIIGREGSPPIEEALRPSLAMARI